MELCYISIWWVAAIVLSEVALVHTGPLTVIRTKLNWIKWKMVCLCSVFSSKTNNNKINIYTQELYRVMYKGWHSAECCCCVMAPSSGCEVWTSAWSVAAAAATPALAPDCGHWLRSHAGPGPGDWRTRLLLSRDSDGACWSCGRAAGLVTGRGRGGCWGWPPPWGRGGACRWARPPRATRPATGSCPWAWAGPGQRSSCLQWWGRGNG